MEQVNEIAREDQSRSADPQWPELVSRAVNDLSRIVHAEIRLASLGFRGLMEQEIDRAVKIAIALVLLVCAAVCAVGAAVIGLHVLLGLWWAAFAVVAAVSGVAGVIFFLLARGRPQQVSSA